MLPLILISAAAACIASVIYYKNYYLGKEGNTLRRDYSELIYLLSGSHCVSEEIVGARNYRLQFQKSGNRHCYLLSEVDNRLIVVWTRESKKDGKQNHEWSFASGYDQYQMFDEIATDISAYEGQVFSHNNSVSFN